MAKPRPKPKPVQLYIQNYFIYISFQYNKHFFVYNLILIFRKFPKINAILKITVDRNPHLKEHALLLNGLGTLTETFLSQQIGAKLDRDNRKKSKTSLESSSRHDSVEGCSWIEED
eukprot:NP_496809.1 Uncharacterized protein CELE_Y48C3A.1 [Caenorhabditis elegans]